MAQAHTSSYVASLLSLVLPGAGQLVRGNPFSAIFWFILVFVGYLAFVVPGVILHLFCVADVLDPPRGRGRWRG